MINSIVIRTNSVDIDFPGEKIGVGVSGLADVPASLLFLQRVEEERHTVVLMDLRVHRRLRVSGRMTNNGRKTYVNAKFTLACFYSKGLIIVKIKITRYKKRRIRL